MCSSRCIRVCKDSSKLLKCCKPTMPLNPPGTNVVALVKVLPKDVPIKKPEAVIPKLLLHNTR